MPCKSSAAVVKVMTSTEESEEAMKGGDDRKSEIDVRRCILLD